MRFSLDRILVMYRGYIVADLVANETDLEEVGRLMGGLARAQRRACDRPQRAVSCVH